MSCVQHQLGTMHGGPPSGSTSKQLADYGEANDQKLADMIKLGMVAFSSQHQRTVTPQGLKAALLGPDRLGLNGGPPIALFMQKMFEPPAQPEEVEAGTSEWVPSTEGESTTKTRKSTATTRKACEGRQGDSSS